MAKIANNGQPAPNPHYKGVVTDCGNMINEVVDMKIRDYVKDNDEREDRLVVKMDELINIVRKEYTVNRVLIFAQFGIDMLIFATIWVMWAYLKR